MATFKDYVDSAAADLTLRRVALLERLETVAMLSPAFIGAVGYLVARTNDTSAGRWTAWSLALLMLLGLLAAMTVTAVRRLSINAMDSRATVIVPLALGAVMAVAASGVAFRSAPVAAIGFLAIVTGLYVLGIRLYRKVSAVLLPENRPSR